MRRLILIIIACGVAVVGIILLINKINDEGETVPDATINKAIKKFEILMASDDYREFDFSRADEIKSFAKGLQFKYYTIPFKLVEHANNNTDILGLVKSYEMIDVTLIDSTGQIRSSIRFSKKNGKWRPVSYGFTTEIKWLSLSQKVIPASELANSRLISIPSMHITLLANSNSGSNMFRMLDKNPIWVGYQPGDTINPKKCMQKLIPLALEISTRREY